MPLKATKAQDYIYQSFTNYGPCRSEPSLLAKRHLSEHDFVRSHYSSRRRIGPKTVSYSMSVFFLMIPMVTETLTCVPVGAPIVASPESPVFPPLYTALLDALERLTERDARQPVCD
jgi:hypothetical protein